MVEKRIRKEFMVKQKPKQTICVISSRQGLWSPNSIDYNMFETIDDFINVGQPPVSLSLYPIFVVVCRCNAPRKHTSAHEQDDHTSLFISPSQIIKWTKSMRYERKWEKIEISLLFWFVVVHCKLKYVTLVLHFALICSISFVGPHQPFDSFLPSACTRLYICVRCVFKYACKW